MASEARTYPERIWAGHLGGGKRTWKPELAHESEKAFSCAYVRADRLESLMEENAALREALEGLERFCSNGLWRDETGYPLELTSHVEDARAALYSDYQPAHWR